MFNKLLRRARFLLLFAKLDACLIGMESCSNAHHWARELTDPGHEVRLIPPMYVKPYVKRGTSDALDAEAICEAIARPTMRFVATRTVEQKFLLSRHRACVRLLRTIPGAGAVTASAIIASIGDGHRFENGRAYAAWLGLTPANKSSGGKEKLGQITTLSGHRRAIPCPAARQHMRSMCESGAVDGGSVLTVVAGRWYDITRSTNTFPPRASQQMAYILA